MARLNEEQIKNAKAWLHDIFVAGNIFPNPKRAIEISKYSNMYGTGRDYRHSTRRPNIIEKAKLLCEAIKNRRVDTQLFKSYDEALQFFSTEHFYKTLDTTYSFDAVRKPATMLARYISWFCTDAKKFIWYDGNLSTYEREEIQKTTLGAALYADGCFESQQNGNATPKTTSKATTSPRAASTGVPGQPQNNFKSRGPLSNVAVDLIGAPNQKIQLSAPIFTVYGFNSNGDILEDTMYIRPVEADPASQKKYTVAGTNKVLFGKAKGYGYCQIYWSDIKEAERVVTNALTAGIKLPSNIAQLKVCQINKPLTNGYFNIGTEYGPVYISASKLNEELVEDTKTTEPNCTLTNREKWERYEEAFYHDCN